MSRTNWPRWARRVSKVAPGLPGYSPSGGGLPAGATATSLTDMAALMSQGRKEFELDDQGNLVQFGPGRSPQPSPLGADPRAYQFRQGWNYPTSPGEGKLVDWGTLRTLPRVYEIMGKAITLRIDEICDLHFDIIARDRDTRKARQTLQTRSAKISEIKDFFAYPDRRLPWQRWLRSLLFQQLTYDAATVYIRRDLDPDGGPTIEGEDEARLGNAVALEVVDGSTIKPLLDPSGRMPLAPAPAFQQYLYGVPRASFTAQELIYAPKETFVDTPYGFSPVEQSIMHINLALRFWQSMLAIYTDGSLPEGVAEAPPDWTTEQINEFSEVWNSMLAGDPRAYRKLRFVPSGFQFHDFKGLDFNESFARYLLDVTCVCFDVTPMELGMEPSHGGLGGKGLGETMVDVSLRRSIRPTLSWLFDSILNPILWNEFGATDLEWTAIELDEQGEKDKAEAQDLNLRNGRIPLDELIEEDGGTPIGVGRLFVFGTTVLGEPDLKAISQRGALAAGYLPSGGMFDQQQTPPGDPAASKDEVAQHEQGKPTQNDPNGSSRESGIGGENESLEDPQSTAGPQMKLRELRRWETKALRAVKAGRNANVRFVAEYLPELAALTTRTALDQCQTTEDVRDAFRRLRSFAGEDA